MVSLFTGNEDVYIVLYLHDTKSAAHCSTRITQVGGMNKGLLAQVMGSVRYKLTYRGRRRLA